MAKKASANSASPDTNNEQKKRKKQAKREAKMMLEIEEAKGSVQKAEKQVAKAQALLEAQNAHLRTLEGKLAEIRTPQEEIEVSAPDAGFDHQGGQPEQEETAMSAPGAGSNPQSEQAELEHDPTTSVEQETVSAEQES